MSQALVNKINDLEKRMDQIVDVVQNLMQASEKSLLDQVIDVLADKDRTLETMRKQIEDLYILRGAIARDCVEMLGNRRPVIDPRKVPMPHTLRNLGFLPPEERVDDAA